MPIWALYVLFLLVWLMFGAIGAAYILWGAPNLAADARQTFAWLSLIIASTVGVLCALGIELQRRKHLAEQQK